MGRLKLKDCQEEGKGIVVCRFDDNGSEVVIRGTVDPQTGRPSTIDVISSKGSDLKVVELAKKFTAQQIKAKRGEF